MIFKTITDESTLSGQKIVGALKARQIAQQQATMQLEVDIACLKQYELACKSGTVTTEQFDTIMKKASVTAVDYAAKIKAGTGSAQSYANVQRATNAALQSTSVGATLASKAVKLFSASLNMIAFTAILAGLNWVINKVDELIVTADEAKESADAFKESLSSFFDETQSNLKTITSLSDRFDELSKNVDANGKQIGGTTEEYDEFLGICEQVGQIMPELITGYTNEGQAIITLRGEVDSLTESYENAIRAKAALFLSNGDDEGNTIDSFFDDYNNFVQGDQGFLGLKIPPSGQNTAEEFEQYYGYDKVHGWLSDVTYATLEDLQNLRAGTIEYVYLARVLKEAGYEISEISADNYNAIHDVFNSRMTVIEQGITDRVTNIKNAFQNMLYADSEYWEIDDNNIISAINSVYASIDDEFIKQNNLFSKTALQTFESDLVSLFTNDATKQAMLNFYAPMSEDETVKEYTDRVTSALNTVQTYCNENGIVIPIEIGDSSEGVDSLVNNVKEKLKGTDFDDKVGELSFGDLQIASELEVPLDSIESWEELLALIQKVKDETLDNEITVSFNYDKLENLESKLSSIQSAYDSLTSAIQEYNKQGYLSMETIDTLIALDDEYINALIDENGQIQYNTETFKELAKIKLEEAKASIYQELCTDLVKIKELETAVAANELALANGTLTQSAYDTAKALYEEVIAMGGANKALGIKAWDTAQKKIALLDNQLQAVTDSTYDFGKATKDAEKSAKEYVDSYMEFMKSSLETNRIDFRTYSNDVSVFLKKMFDEGKISGKEYFDYTKEMLEVQQNIYDKALSAINRRFDKEIEKINKSIDAIKKHNDVLNEQKDNYDKILSVIDSVYENEVKKIEEQKQVLQDKINALNDEADAYDLIRRKEQALYALEQSQNQRVKKIYSGSERGIIYTTDQEKIREVQDNLKDIENEEIISMLEKEQEALDKSIESLEKYRNMWQEISDVYEIEQNKQLAIALFGKGYEDFILSNRLSNIEDFKNNYISIQKQIDNNESMIKSYEEKIQYYEDLKSQWNSITNAYEQSIEDQYAVMLLGQNWEKDVLSGRIDTLNNFANNYFNIQKAIADAAWNSANEQIKAAEAAQRAQPSVDTVETKEPKHYNTRYKVVVAGAPIKDFGNSYTAKVWMKNNAPSGTIVPYQVPVYTKGGVIGTKKSPLDSIAQSLGEDHLVAGKEGERFLTPVQNEMWEKWTEALPNLQNFANMLQYNIPNYNFDNMVLRSNNKPTPTINIGDIHLHEVQNVPDFAKALQKHLPNISVQYNGKH